MLFSPDHLLWVGRRAEYVLVYQFQREERKEIRPGFWEAISSDSHNILLHKTNATSHHVEDTTEGRTEKHSQHHWKTCIGKKATWNKASLNGSFLHCSIWFYCLRALPAKWVGSNWCDSPTMIQQSLDTMMKQMSFIQSSRYFNKNFQFTKFTAQST